MTTLVFAACFLALAALAGLAASNGGRWALRLPLLAATPVLALAVWWQLSQRDGWPADSRPANGSAFVASVVQAPTSDSAGAIYLWAQAPSSNTPRAFRLPYSRELERQVSQAARARKQGARVGVRATTYGRAGQRRTTQMHARRGLRGPRGRRGAPSQATQSTGLQFYRLPPPKLPVKDPSTRF
jgi:hypothetical protein